MLEAWIRKYFPEALVPEVMRVLAEYGAESWHREADRVRRDLVVLSRGDAGKLLEVLELAKKDYREILAGEEVDAWLSSELEKGP